MKSVLISIQPKWCELIASGKKTVEVRKTKPKIDVPFKCYIYCTSSNVHECLMQNESGVNLIHCINYKTAIPCGGEIANGKVIGEFVCDSIYHYRYTKPFFYHGIKMYHTNEHCTKACLTWEELENYLGDKDGYGWHISDLVIYDKPKELGEFEPLLCDYNFDTECGYKGKCKHQETTMCWGYITKRCNKQITRPPQSWCYVEVTDNET